MHTDQPAASLLFVCGIAAVSALEQHKIDDRLERLQNKIKDLGISATPEQVKHGLAQYDTQHALAVKKQGVTKMLNNGDVWTGCGHTAHVDKRTFDKILIYGRPRDTSDE